MAVKLLITLLVFPAGFALFTQLRASREEERAEAAYPPEGQLLMVNGHRVHAVVMGEGPDVVLIHGANGSTRDMTFRLAPALAGRYRVIVLDRPGFGYSERIDRDGASILQQAELLSEAALQLGAEAPIVLGQSYGGSVALAWAVYHPDRLSALVTLAAPAHPWDSPLPAIPRINSSALGSALVVPLITAYVPRFTVERAISSAFDPQDIPAGYIAHFGPEMSVRRMSLRENALQRASLLDEIERMHTRYSGVAVPAEILHGTADTTVGLSIHAEPLSSALPGAVLTRLDGIGHMIQNVAVPEVAAAVDRAAARAGLR